MDSYYNTLKNEDDKYYEDIYKITHVEKILNATTQSYWLASRSISSTSDGAYFRIRAQHASSSSTMYWNMCYIVPGVSIKGDSSSHGFRPVFTLKSEIKMISGNGDTIPYTLSL